MAGTTWLWLEDLSGGTGAPWSEDQYVQAAVSLARFNASWLRAPEPPEPWMLQGADRRLFTSPAGEGAIKELPDRSGSDEVMDALLPAELLESFVAYWDHRHAIFAALDDLPTVLSHHDCHNANLCLIPIGAAAYDVVAVDWAYCGLGALGADLGALVTSDLLWLRYPAEQFEDLARSVFESYVAALGRDLGPADAAALRLAFAAHAGFSGSLRVLFRISRWLVTRNPGPLTDRERRGTRYAAVLHALKPLVEEAATLTPP